MTEWYFFTHNLSVSSSSAVVPNSFPHTWLAVPCEPLGSCNSMPKQAGEVRLDLGKGCQTLPETQPCTSIGTSEQKAAFCISVLRSCSVSVLPTEWKMSFTPMHSTTHCSGWPNSGPITASAFIRFWCFQPPDLNPRCKPSRTAHTGEGGQFLETWYSCKWHLKLLTQYCGCFKQNLSWNLECSRTLLAKD